MKKKQRKIKVLVVDDSAIVRQSLRDILNSDPEIEVIATASDPFFAAKKIQSEIPDVITLDIKMPRMDGLTFLQKIMSQHPIPVVICASLDENDIQITSKALRYGAVDIIKKPRMGTKKFFNESKLRICNSVKAASIARLQFCNKRKQLEPKLNADVIIPKPNKKKPINRLTEKIVVVGASTGGTEALRIFFEALPPDAPSVVVVQHMPETFTTAFSKRMDELSRVSVKEAENNDIVRRGRVLIAPGNYHMILQRNSTKYYVQIKGGPPVSRHKPSVDVLFRSAARYAGKNAIGVIMTGMGDDGAQGMLEMKQAGAYTIAQDKASSVVFGMPQEAIKKGAVDRVISLRSIAGAVLQKCL
ncbi:protein-glutamate methylesterase/protein glutamine deamidase [Candidatus Magnetomoraceae bacterium gMMP-15]